MRNCVTHHHACDCREEKFKKLEAENQRLEKELELQDEQNLGRQNQVVHKFEARMKEVAHNLEARIKETTTIKHPENNQDETIEKLKDALEVIRECSLDEHSIKRADTTLLEVFGVPKNG